jgi:type II secretory pathway pseudopilin PulG
MDLRSQRGSALLMSMVVVVVITIIGVAVIRFSTREVAGATAGARHEALVACAEAGRKLLTSQFHAIGMAPTTLDALNTPLDGAAGVGRTMAVGGHVDSVAAAVQVDQVVFLPDNAFGPSTRVRDLSNVISLAGQGGKPLRVLVHCQDGSANSPTGGRQLEVEFGVRFGL